MKKELVLIKDLNNYWSCALCYTCTESKNITDDNEAINVIRNTYPALSNAEYVVEGNEIYAIVGTPLTPINVEEGCSE